MMPPTGPSRDEQLVNLAIEGVDRAAEIASAGARGLRVRDKGVNDPVSEADERIEREIGALLSKHSGIRVQGEEFSPDTSDDEFWSLDPIDGTFNFIFGVPIAAVSLALFREGRPVIGVIADLNLQRRYVAAPGRSATLDGKPIACLHNPLARSALMIGDFSSRTNPEIPNDFRGEVVARSRWHAARTRMIGSAALDLAWVAAGCAAASITFSNKLWDVGAGAALVLAAGGQLLDIHGRPWTTASDSLLAVASAETTDEFEWLFELARSL